MLTRQRNFFLFIISFYLITGCSSGPTIIIVKDKFEKEASIENPVIVTEKKIEPAPIEIKKVEPVKPKIINYTGPEYTIGILSFDNKTDLNAFGLGEELSSQLSEMALAIDLEPLLLSSTSEEENMIELKVSGTINSYKESVNEGDQKEAFIDVVCLVEEVLTGRVIVNRNISVSYIFPNDPLPTNVPAKKQPVSLRKGAIGAIIKNLQEPLIEELNRLSFRGRIVASDRDKVFFRAGSRSKIKSGTILEVYPPNIKNEDIGKKRMRSGEIILQSHQTEKISEGTIVSGSEFETGSIVVPVVN